MSKNFWDNLLFMPSLLLIAPVYVVSLLLPMRDEEDDRECAVLRCVATKQVSPDLDIEVPDRLVERQAY